MDIVLPLVAAVLALVALDVQALRFGRDRRHGRGPGHDPDAAGRR